MIWLSLLILLLIPIFILIAIRDKKKGIAREIKRKNNYRFNFAKINKKGNK